MQGGFHIKLLQILGNAGGLWDILLREREKMHRNRNERQKSCTETMQTQQTAPDVWIGNAVHSGNLTPFLLGCLDRGFITKNSFLKKVKEEKEVKV